MSAAAIRYSMRVALALPGIARSAVVRFSTPQVAVVGAQVPSTMRLYEFTVGATTAVSSGMSETCPATACSIAFDMPPAPSANTFFCPSHRERWMCPEQPGSFSLHLAMKQGVTPWRCASSFTAVLKRAALSAARSPSSTPIAASKTPGPVSVWKPSTWTSKAASPSRSSCTRSRAWLVRTQE